MYIYIYIYIYNSLNSLAATKRASAFQETSVKFQR